jgi:hypothetical protein
VVNESLEERTFRMDQLSDLSLSLRRDDCLFKADIGDAYYHLRLRKVDQLYLSFCVGGVVYVPACLNCALAVAPWSFSKAMKPVVSYLREHGHRIFSYLDDFFGAGATARNDSPATKPTPRGRSETFARCSRGSASRCIRRSATSPGRGRWRSLRSLSIRAARNSSSPRRS